jgi:hypothetical protein
MLASSFSFAENISGIPETFSGLSKGDLNAPAGR